MTNESQQFLRDLADLRPKGVQDREVLNTLAEKSGLLRETIERIWAQELLSWEVTAVYLHACEENTGIWFGRWEKAAKEQKRRIIGCAPTITQPLPDPGQATNLEELRRLMDEMRIGLGPLSFVTLEKRSHVLSQEHSYPHLPRATLHAKIRNKAPLDAVVAETFAAACGLPPTEARRWGKAHQRLTTATAVPIQQAPSPREEPTSPAQPAPSLEKRPAPPQPAATGPQLSRRGFWRWTGALTAVFGSGALAADDYNRVAAPPPEVHIIRTALGYLRYEQPPLSNGQKPSASPEDQDGQTPKTPTYSIKVSELDEEILPTLARSARPWYMDVILYVGSSRSERLSNYSYYGDITYEVVVNEETAKGPQSLTRGQKIIQIQDIALGDLSSTLKELEFKITFTCKVEFPDRSPQARNKEFDLLVTPGEIIFHSQPFTQEGRAAAEKNQGNWLNGTDSALTPRPAPRSGPGKKNSREIKVGFGRARNSSAIGSFEGMLIDKIVSKIGEKSGDQLKVTHVKCHEWPLMDMEQALLEPRKAKEPIDMLIGAYSITERRRDRILFAGPYLITRQAVLVRADSGIEEFDDVRNAKFRLGYREGSTPFERLKTLFGEEWAKRSGEKITSYTQGIEKTIQRDGISAISTDRVILVDAVKELKSDRGSLKLIDLPSSSSLEEWGIGLHPRHPFIDPHLLNEILKELINGTWWKAAVERCFNIPLPGPGLPVYLHKELLEYKPAIP